MNSNQVTVVRIYLNEGHDRLDALLKRLHDQERVRGVSVFRGVAGFGDSGQVHTGRLLDLSLELPLVVEFFDTPERASAVMQHLQETVKPGHMLSWPATISSSE